MGLYYGIYYGTSEAAGDVPAADVDDFVDTVGGEELNFERDPEEELVGQAESLGILGDDPMLTLDENGNIVAADGIDLSKLEDLLNKILEGQIQFEDFEGYLQQIIQLLGKSNTNTSSIEKITQNILEYEMKAAGNFALLKSAMEGCKAEMQKQTGILGDIYDILNPDPCDPSIDPPKVPIIDKFPFSLPWDFYNLITIFVADEKPPIFKVPIKTTIDTGGLGYEIDEEITLDLTQFRIGGVDMVRAITRSAFIILAVLGLIFATRKLIWK